MRDTTTLPATINGLRAARPGDVEWATPAAQSGPVQRPSSDPSSRGTPTFSPERSTFGDAMTSARQEAQVPDASRARTGQIGTGETRTADRPDDADKRTKHGDDGKQSADSPRPEAHPDDSRKSAGDSSASENGKAETQTKTRTDAKAPEDGKRPQGGTEAENRQTAADPIAADDVGASADVRTKTGGGNMDDEPPGGEEVAPASAEHGMPGTRDVMPQQGVDERPARDVGSGSGSGSDPAADADPDARSALQPAHGRSQTNAAAGADPKENRAAQLTDPVPTTKAASVDALIPADRAHSPPSSPAASGESLAAHLAEARSLLANHAARPVDAAMRSAPGAAHRDSIPTPVNDPSFPGRFAASVALLGSAGIERAEIRLHPRELGPIRIELSMNGEAARIAFSAAHPDTRHAIEQSLPILKDLLAERGLQLGNTNVSDGREEGRKETFSGTASSADAAVDDVAHEDGQGQRETTLRGNVRPALLSIYA